MPEPDYDHLRRLLADEAAPTPAPLEPPGFSILAEIGRGTMGVVYRALDQGTGRIVALKVLQSSGVTSPALRARFEREGEVLSRIDDPGIVRLHAVGEVAGHPYLVMDLVEGSTLADLLATGAVSPEVGTGYLIAVARAVETIHRAGFVHRDLKPRNLLIDAEGRPRVTDFGVAKVLSDDPAWATLTRSGMLVGTIRYMSPEQVAGDIDRIDARTDVFGLGVALYEVLTGRLPFGGQTAGEVSDAIRECRPIRPSRLQPTISPALEAVCLRALARRPEDRFTSAGPMAVALEQAVAGPGRPRARRRAPALLAAAALVVGLLVLAGLATRPAGEEPVPAPPPPADRPIEDAGLTVFRTSGDGPAPVVLFHPAGPSGPFPAAAYAGWIEHLTAAGLSVVIGPRAVEPGSPTLAELLGGDRRLDGDRWGAIGHGLGARAAWSAAAAGEPGPSFLVLVEPSGGWSRSRGPVEQGPETLADLGRATLVLAIVSRMSGLEDIAGAYLDRAPAGRSRTLFRIEENAPGRGYFFALSPGPQLTAADLGDAIPPDGLATDDLDRALWAWVDRAIAAGFDGRPLEFEPGARAAVRRRGR